MRNKSVTVAVEWKRDLDFNATETQQITHHFSFDEDVTPERLAAAVLETAPVPA